MSRSCRKRRPNRVLGEVQDHIRQPLHVPPGVGRWLNFADRLAPVALDADLANDFTPSDKVTDHRVKNPYRLDLRVGGPRAASGYLSDQAVRDAVR